MIVLGVDPGSRVTGYGIVEKKDNELFHVCSGQIRSSGKIPFYERIHHIFQSMTKIMDEYHPAEMAIEDMFYAKNVQSSLKLGHARGAVLIAAVQCGLQIFEYTPLEIKKSIAGYGRASKEQVRSMVKVILKLRGPLDLDPSDALAAAICHLNWVRFEHSGRSYARKISN
ncbi:MAG: crossover junction endodeoxyribonuclease RuvC [Deltaproteobacteria bacterium]|nr:MAG: crossover junction endodeoxyribonuclease RuvC [Desulfococcus sp. 4484_242]RLC30554.1 MAG: crossover junction endodeoxyribonuclease RuvC [Deltaproteobacteria bacterium]